jgi:hypothetical protein
MKNVLFEQKKIKLRNKWHLIKNKVDIQQNVLTLQRGQLGDARHAARSHSLHNISTKLRANVIGLVWPY